MIPNPLETLMTEHRLIERVLEALEACARRAEGGAEVQPAALRGFARFLRGYADELHHGKEEALLFEKMVEAGFPREVGPVAVMRIEHEQGRALVGELRALSERVSWSAEDRRRAASVALDFAALLRAHILKEDRILYPMAEQRLSPQAMQLLGEECQAFVERHLDTDRELEALGIALEKEWGGQSPAPALADDHHAACSVCSAHGR